MEILSSAYVFSGNGKIIDIELEVYLVENFNDPDIVFQLSRFLNSMYGVKTIGHLESTDDGYIPLIISTERLMSNVTYKNHDYTLKELKNSQRSLFPWDHRILSGLIHNEFIKLFRPYLLDGETDKYYFPSLNKIFSDKEEKLGNNFVGKRYCKFYIDILTNGKFLIHFEVRTRWRSLKTLSEYENKVINFQTTLEDEHLPVTHKYTGKGFIIDQIIRKSPKEYKPPVLGKTVYEGVKEFWGEDQSWEEIKENMKNDTLIFKVLQYRPQIPLSIQRRRDTKRYLPSSMLLPMLTTGHFATYCEILGLNYQLVNKEYFRKNNIEPSIYRKVIDSITDELKKLTFSIGKISFSYEKYLTNESVHSINNFKPPDLILRSKKENEEIQDLFLKWNNQMEKPSYIEWDFEKEDYLEGNKDKYIFPTRIGGTVSLGTYKDKEIYAFKTCSSDRKAIALFLPKRSQNNRNVVSGIKSQIFTEKWKKFIFGRSKVRLEEYYYEDSLDHFKAIFNEAMDQCDGSFISLRKIPYSNQLYKLYKELMISNEFAIQGFFENTILSSAKFSSSNILFQFLAKMGGTPFQIKPKNVNGLKNPLSFGFDLSPYPTGGQIASIVTAFSPDFSQANIYSQQSAIQHGLIFRDLDKSIPEIFKIEEKRIESDGGEKPDYVVLLRDGSWMGIDEYAPVAKILEDMGIPYVVASSIGSGFGKIMRKNKLNFTLRPQIGDSIEFDNRNLLFVPHHLDYQFQKPIRIVLNETSIPNYEISHLRDFVYAATFANIAYANPSKVREPIQVVGSHKAAEAIRNNILGLGSHRKNLFYLFYIFTHLYY